jgi:parvulin-like peptidyl-prolyl isomerase
MNGRNKMGGKWIVLALLAGLTSPASGQGEKPMATVNGQPIMKAEVEAILKRQPPSAAPLTEAQHRQAQSEALDYLINETIMRQFLKRAMAGKPPISPYSAAVTKHVKELADGLAKKNQTLAAFLKETGQSEDELRASIIKEMQWEAYINDNLSAEDVQKYYEAYKPFFDKVLVRARHILIRVPQSADETERRVARNRLLELRKQIVSGKLDFAEAAKKNSDCTSKEQGGDLNFFPRKFVVLEPFARAAFALKVGEISSVVETDYGLHLIKVEERTKGEPTQFEDVKAEVRRICMMEMGMTILEREHKAAKIVLTPQ